MAISVDTDTLAAVVLAQNATYHTKDPAIFEQIRTYVWSKYKTSGDIPWTFAVTDVAGCGAAIYAAFIAAGVTQALGGVAYWLEKIGNTVLTYPYTRASNDVLDYPTA